MYSHKSRLTKRLVFGQVGYIPGQYHGILGSTLEHHVPFYTLYSNFVNKYKLCIMQLTQIQIPTPIVSTCSY